MESLTVQCTHSDKAFTLYVFEVVVKGMLRILCIMTAKSLLGEEASGVLGWGFFMGIEIDAHQSYIFRKKIENNFWFVLDISTQ